MEENLTISFSELPTIAQVLEEFIPDDATCISVKINVPDFDPSDNNFTPPSFTDIVRYLKDSSVDILACSSGIHLEGRNDTPHIHYHFVCNHYNEPTNPSQHRKRWLSKECNSHYNLDNVSFKYQRLEARKPKYQFLAYPLKEGRVLLKRHYLYNGDLMSKDMRDFLLSVGSTIYQQAFALRLRQEKLQYRRQLAFSELCDLVGEKEFSSFNELCDWFDDNYLYKLNYDELPDPKNYKTNIRKIGIKKRLLRTRDI